MLFVCTMNNPAKCLDKFVSMFYIIIKKVNARNVKFIMNIY